MRNKKIKTVFTKIRELIKYIKINMLINKVKYLDKAELGVLSNVIEAEILFRGYDEQGKAQC